MALDLDELLRRSKTRFQTSILGILERYNYPFEDDFVISMETLTYDTPDGPKQWGDLSIKELRKLFKHHVRSQRTEDQTASEESDAEIVSVRRRFEDIHFQNLDVDDVKTQEKVQVQVDVIVQDNGRRIPKWITVEPSSSHFTSPIRELKGNQSSVCRKKVELANECSSSSPYQLQFSGVPMLPDTITVPRHQSFQEMNETCYNSTLEEYQSADESCSWSNVTLADLYPKMVEVLTKLITRETWKKTFKLYRNKRGHARRPKLSITVEKIRKFRPLKLKKALPSICSSSTDIQNQTFGNNVKENSGPCDDQCFINNSSGMVPFSYSDTNEMEMDCSDSSLDYHLVFGKDQKLSEQNANALGRMGETFLADQLQTTVSLNSSKYNKSGKLTYKHSLEPPFRTSARSGSVAFHLAKESKTQKNDFPSDGTSGFCSPTCSIVNDSNTFTPIKDYYLASGTLLINPEINISERQNSFQRRHSFSSLSMKQSPSETPQKFEDAFEKLYYKLLSRGSQKPLTLTKPLSNSQKFEEKGGIMKNTLNDSVRSNVQYNIAFEKIYQQLSSEVVPKIPGFQRASNLRKYEGIQMSETVNALVNSPVRSLYAIPRVKRLGNFQNDLLSSPVKRLKNIPEHFFFSTKRQQISHKKYGDLQTVGMDSASLHNGSNTRSFNSHNCHHQDSAFHASSDKTFLVIPDASWKELENTDVQSSWRRTMPNYSSPGNALKCPQKVSRKLSYTDGKDRNPSNPLDNVLVKTQQGAFMAYRENNVVL